MWKEDLNMLVIEDGVLPFQYLKIVIAVHDSIPSLKQRQLKASLFLYIVEYSYIYSYVYSMSILNILIFRLGEGLLDITRKLLLQN